MGETWETFVPLAKEWPSLSAVLESVWGGCLDCRLRVVPEHAVFVVVVVGKYWESGGVCKLSKCRMAPSKTDVLNVRGREEMNGWVDGFEAAFDLSIFVADPGAQFLSGRQHLFCKDEART